MTTTYCPVIRLSRRLPRVAVAAVFSMLAAIATGLAFSLVLALPLLVALFSFVLVLNTLLTALYITSILTAPVSLLALPVAATVLKDSGRRTMILPLVGSIAGVLSVLFWSFESGLWNVKSFGSDLSLFVVVGLVAGGIAGVVFEVTLREPNR